MVTYNQLTRSKVRKKKTHKRRSPALKGCPQKKGMCMKLSVTSPKKPNSAIRKIAKVFLTSTERYIIAYIPGHGHNIQQYANVIIRGGRVKDLPGVKYHLVRGKLDFGWKERFDRSKRRSKYGAKRQKKNI